MLEQIIQDLQILQPTLFCAVPRLLTKIQNIIICSLIKEIYCFSFYIPKSILFLLF